MNHRPPQRNGREVRSVVCRTQLYCCRPLNRVVYRRGSGAVNDAGVIASVDSHRFDNAPGAVPADGTGRCTTLTVTTENAGRCTRIDLACRDGGAILLGKGEFHKLIDVLRPDEVPDEVTEKLDLLLRYLGVTQE